MNTKTILIVVSLLILISAGFFMARWLPVATPPSSTNTTISPPIASDANYIKQHSLFLVNTAPGPGNPTLGYSIFTTRSDGSSKTVLTTEEGGSSSWTPDGKVIFISKQSGSQQIWLMNADGANAHHIINLSAIMRPLMPQMGKNGLIVFVDASLPEDNQGIYLMQQDGSGLKELTRGMQPSLALSGTWIAYTYQTNNPYHREIWRINTDGTGKKELTTLGDPDYPDANAPSISPNEKWVAFFSGKESNLMLPGAPQQSIFDWGYRNVAIVPAEGGARKTLTPCKQVNTQIELEAATAASGHCIAADNPAWTLDSAWLIFDAGFSDGTSTWLVDINGQNFQTFYPVSRGIERVPLKFTN